MKTVIINPIDEKELIIDDLKLQIKNMKNEKMELETQVKQLIAEVEKQKKETIKYMEWYETIRNSTIWRGTRFIRIFCEFLRGKTI